jgi:hypothetical protein
MTSFDGGHYFFTAIVPICNEGIVEHEGLRSSPIHVLRETLETMPTALDSRAAEDVGIQSPFARSARTHFARLIVLDQPFFNGRDRADAIAAAVRKTDLLAAEPADELACPNLIVIFDFDPVDPSGKGEPRGYLEELWTLMRVELTDIFRYAYGFSKVVDAKSFADMLIDCELETTMPFNDYWTVAPPFASLTIPALIVPPAFGVAAALAATLWRGWPWWAGLMAAVVLGLAGVVADYFWVMGRGRRPFPAAPDSTLRHVLKALYLQQAFARFARAQQGTELAGRAAAFRAFLAEHEPGNLDGPTQSAGVIRTRLEKAPS